MTDIAIVGLGCRFPGARDLRAYWTLLMSAQRQFRAVPAQRWNHDVFHDPGDPSAPHAAYTDQVALLDDVDRFDALHYGVPPARARATDPQHRLMLDVTREALDDAGLGRRDFDRENTGVFCAMSVSDYKDVMAAPIRAIALADQARRSATGDSDPDPAAALDAVRAHAERLATVQPFSLPGSLLNMAAGTVSRHFDLGGPSFAVDAACSGSLVALDQAVAQLRQGGCRIAVVGAVHVNLTPDSLIGFSTLRALSATGVCRPFDEQADGFVLGEGAGAVVIRPLADALAAGDRVYAVIKGIGSANDGASPGPLAPAPEGQLRALRRAYQDADLPPSSVGFLEAHGTATRSGDRAEIEALRRLRTEYPDDDPSLCYLGAGKALIGHSLAAAGMAGLIKTALVVHHRTIVPQPRTTAHPDLAVGAAGLRFAETARPWPRTGTPRRAAVSSFGFGGTNVHVVLEEAPAPAPAPAPEPARPSTARGTQDTEGTQGAAQVVLLSAGSAELLDLHIGEVLDAVQRTPRTPVGALAHTLGGREPLKARLAIVAADTEEFTRLLLRARARLAEGARGDLGEGTFAADAPLPAAQRRIAFVFPGQGSQRPGMMRDLYERFAGFRTTLDTLGSEVRRAADVDPAALLYGETAPADAHSRTAPAPGHGGGTAEELRRRLTDTEVCQPLLGTVQIAATRLLADCGVLPDLALGHSVGEFAAAAAAGALTGEETVRLLAHRGAALRRAGNGLRGGMIAVQSDPQTCRRLLTGIDDVWLACFNHPRQVVLSGTPQGLADVRRACTDAGIATVTLEVSDAFHSPRLACAEEAVRTDLAGRRVHPPRLAFVSSVSGTPCTDPEELRELWARHASAPVRFTDAVRASYDAGARLYLQVGGGGSLLDPVRRNLADRDDVHLLAATGAAPDGARAFAQALARLAVLGVPVDPRTLVPAHERRLIDLPVARLAGQPYWAGRTTPPKPKPKPKPEATPEPKPPSPDLPHTAPPATAPPHTEPPVHPMDDLRQLVRDQVELMSRFSGAARAPAGEEPAPIGEEPAPAADPAEVTASVFAHTARISAFPVDHLRPEHVLTDDLGFDSLMLTDLFTALRRQWPHWTFDEHDADRPTVGGVAAAIAGATAQPAPGAVPEQRAAHAAPGAVPPPPPAADPPTGPGGPTRPAPRPEEHTRIDRFPEVTAHAERVGALAGTGLSNPYFLVHESGMTDTTVIGGREFLSFSGYNYLGLATHPRVNEAAKQAIDTYGTSVSASRLLSGSRPLHTELETELAALLGCEASVTLANGHATNVTVIGHLVGPGDLVVHDALAHDSILQGCRLSGATRRPFPHNDAAALDHLLEQVRHQYRRVLVVIEGVYSMDGDIADLPALVAVKQRHGALLMVDEAHSIGTTGATGGGVGEHFGIDRRDVDLWSGTLSKALAGCGGYVAASSPVVEYLRYTAPGFVYSAGMTPADTAACLASLRLLRDEPERVARLAANAALFVRLARDAGVDTGDSHGTPVVPCVVGDSLKALRLAQALFRRGVSVNPILHPAVPEHMARLRFFVTREHTPGQIRHTVTALAQELRRLDQAAAA